MTPTYAYLTTHSNVWFQDTIAMCPGYRSVTYPASVLGLSEAPNPYGLPLDDRADVTLVDTRWFKWLQAQGAGVLEDVFRRLERVSGTIVGVEAYATFRLGAPPQMLDRCAMLLKAQGVYRDRDLYNYDVGPYFPGADWTGRSRPSERRYSDAQLSRIQLSLPNFIAVAPRMRALLRSAHAQQSVTKRAAKTIVEYAAVGLEGRGRRDIAAAYFVGAANHIQRIEALEALREADVPGLFGITNIPDLVFGLKARGTDYLSDEEVAELTDRLRRRDLLIEARPRLSMMRELSRHGIVLSLAGHGELAFRHAEAWRGGAALVCQDLSHVELMYPLKDGVNVRYCRPDLSDMLEVIHELRQDSGLQERIARAGQARWREWSSDLDGLLRRGILDPIARAARSAPTPPPSDPVAVTG